MALGLGEIYDRCLTMSFKDKQNRLKKIMGKTATLFPPGAIQGGGVYIFAE
jgi:hypothetical protein